MGWIDNYCYTHCTEEEAGALGSDGWLVGMRRTRQGIARSSFQFAGHAWSDGVEHAKGAVCRAELQNRCP